MNETLKTHIEDVITNLEEQAKENIRSARRVAIAQGLLTKVTQPLSDSVHINGYGGKFWFDVYNRKDLQALLVLAPLWEKKTVGDVIDYRAEVDGVPFKIAAHDAALPDTCKLVEEEVIIPAQARRVEKRMVVRCVVNKLEETLT